MNEKSIDQLLFEYTDPRGQVDMTSTDDQGLGGAAVDSFQGMKNNLGSYERMTAILAGKEKFEYSLLDNQSMVRALIDHVKQMIKNKERLSLENKSVSERIKELRRKEWKSQAEKDELVEMESKNKAYQLQKTLIRFEKKIDELDDILKRIENGVDVTDKTIKKYEKYVSEIEDSIFHETYVRRNLAYDKGEASSSFKKPAAMENFPIKFIATNGKTYYGIVRPPTGMITWEGKEAREAWLNDADIKGLFSMVSMSKKYSKDAILKIRISKDDFKVLPKELLNDRLFSLKTKNGRDKVMYKDTQEVKDAIKAYIFNDENKGAPRDLTPHRVSGIEGVLDDVKTVQTGIDQSGRPRGITDVIDSIEFWRMIRSLF